MTAMCLKRAGMFHDRGVPSAVVTFDANPELETIRANLVEAGRHHAGVPLLNLHDFYAEHSPARAQGQAQPRTRTLEWVETARTRRSSDGSLFHVDYRMPGNEPATLREYHRADGTIYLIDSTLPSGEKALGTLRALQIITHDGYVAATYSSTSSLYRRFLTDLVNLTNADVVVDSKYSAGFLWSWKHPDAVKFVNFHSTHVAAGQNLLTGKLSTAHQKIIQNREAWDGIVFLTESQRTAFVQRFGDTSNTFVISNPVDGPQTLPAFVDREPGAVLHVGRFTAGKNIGEVLEITAKVAEAGIPVHLGLVGDGDQRPSLEATLRLLGAENLVTFHGHVSDVGHRLDRARVLLMCSKFEGQSLAILEAQAHGCVPVVYDVDFGPKDMIDNQRNGFAVPFGDQDAAVRAVTSLLSNDSLCESMSVQGFNDSPKNRSDVIFRLWMDALDRARMNRSSRVALTAASIRLMGIRFDPKGDIELEVGVDAGTAHLSRIWLESRQRGIPDSQGHAIEPHSGDEGVFHFRLPADLRTQQPAGDALDLNMVLSIGSVTRAIRLGAPPMLQATPYFTVYGNLSLK